MRQLAQLGQAELDRASDEPVNPHPVLGEAAILEL